MRISEVVSIDFETRAVLDLRKTGVHPYAVHPLTDVWCLSYGSEPGNIACYVPRRAQGRLPTALIDHVKNGGLVSGWNVGFELAIWNSILAPRYGFPVLKPEQCIDTQVMAQARGFPKALGDCAEAMRLGVLKDAEGSRLMMQMCKPRRIEKDGTVVWWDDEDKLNRLVDYCDQDVRTEMEIFHKLPALSKSEQDQWLLNHRINERGVPIDLKLVNGAIKIVKTEVDRLNQEIQDITGGAVPKATAVQKIREFLISMGVSVPETLDRFDIAELLTQDLPPAAKRVLQIRQEVGKSSVSKLQAMKHRVSADGRIRGTLKFHGASSTGRWTSAGVQFQNLPRDSVKPPAVIDLIIDEDRDGVDLFSAKNVMPTISAALRNMIAPKPGHVLLVVDYAQIESRAVAYLANDQPKLDVFRQGRDIYKQVGSGMFGLPESEVVDDVRQASKVAELACGFGGGPGALAAMATNYGLDFTEEERVDLVKRWREANQMAKKFWYELKDAAMSAMRNPGVPFQACRGKVAYEKVGNSLRCRLPSGRVIVYPWAEIMEVTAPWSTPEKPETIEAIIYEGISGSGTPVKKTNTGNASKWVKRAAWHGILAENVVQAMCSDLLRLALDALERRGFKIIFHVHDEIVVETGADGAEAKLAEMIRVMTDVPLWATGMPIDAEGHVMARYGK